MQCMRSAVLNSYVSYTVAENSTKHFKFSHKQCKKSTWDSKIYIGNVSLVKNLDFSSPILRLKKYIAISNYHVNSCKIGYLFSNSFLPWSFACNFDLFKCHFFKWVFVFFWFFHICCTWLRNNVFILFVVVVTHYFLVEINVSVSF